MFLNYLVVKKSDRKDIYICGLHILFSLVFLIIFISIFYRQKDLD